MEQRAKCKVLKLGILEENMRESEVMAQMTNLSCKHEALSLTLSSCEKSQCGSISTTLVLEGAEAEGSSALTFQPT